MYELDDLNMDEAVLKQYSGEEEKITISEKIDNKKIVSVGAFAFSEHREIVEITLPETVVSIGAHAFYNCRNLASITLYDTVTDIGDGAFKNCYRLHNINIIGTGLNTKCLKGVLSEVNNEVKVTIHYDDDDAVLVFPYYLYNYEENTPARIVNQITEGSGIQYRECVDGTDVNYMQYDRLFQAGMYIDVKDASYNIACYRLKYTYKLSEDAKRQYKDYLNKNIIEIVNDMVKNEDYDGLNLIFSMEILDRESCMSCIDTARENSHMEGLGQLLAYQKKHFAPSHRKFEF